MGASIEVVVLDPLTPREREVARMVAEGMTNRAIAGAMGYTINTTMMAVSKIYDKLGIGRSSGCESRVILARWVWNGGLQQSSFKRGGQAR